MCAAALESDVISHDSRLAEMDFGAWKMRRWNDIYRREIDAEDADLRNGWRKRAERRTAHWRGSG
jgi:broad specificity phosphatase PhoE